MNNQNNNTQTALTTAIATASATPFRTSFKVTMGIALGQLASFVLVIGGLALLFVAGVAVYTVLQ